MTHPAFSPGTVDPAELDARTVGRGALLKRLTDRIVSSAQDGSRPHTLLVAPRGAGKTHTLQVAIHRALKQRKAAKATLLLTLPEDALAIGSYPDLLVELLRTQGPDISARTRELRGDALELEREILDLAAGRMVLIAIENADRIFDAIGEPGQGSFRAWVETSTAVLVFATAPALFPAVSSRTHPWYGSFIIEELPELTDADIADFLAHHARDRELASYAMTPEGLTRIDDVAQIVGWSPRAWQIVADTVDRTMLQEATPAADAIPAVDPAEQDRVTRFFEEARERMRQWGNMEHALKQAEAQRQAEEAEAAAQREAPSTDAASSSSIGMAAAKPCSIHNASGIV